ncbi:zinc metalloproteinase nas-12-like [Saccostrea echinata]|uniref:zinc metalloproteinase nas-12-like n=1 Tax=Saccostrea echinata TaxID=191078 RepID=UPI002A7F58FE|nr:zinc metalloproteinase nas-12-like [Saccostrea echinata]
MANSVTIVLCCLIAYAYSNTCRDNFDACKMYEKTACESPAFFPWMFHNCALTCGFCRYYNLDIMTNPTTPTTTTTKGPCVDVFNNCTVYSSACGQSEFMSQYCRKTCGGCIPVPIIGNGKIFG